LKLLEDTWKLSSVKREYPVIDAVLSNLELFEKIRPLRPIIRFTSYLLDGHNHRISRKEARKKSISSLLQRTSRPPISTLTSKQPGLIWTLTCKKSATS